jgi:excisionase family DNA binding protein
MTTEAYLSLKDLARYSGLSVRTLRGHIADQLRPLPSYRVGGKVLVRRSDFDVWVSQFRVDRSSIASVDSLIDDVVGALR